MRPDTEIEVDVVARSEHFGDWGGVLALLSESFAYMDRRIELIENHRTFAALGFAKVAETCHPDFTYTTSLTFRKILKD